MPSKPLEQRIRDQSRNTTLIPLRLLITKSLHQRITPGPETHSQLIKRKLLSKLSPKPGQLIRRNITEQLITRMIITRITRVQFKAIHTHIRQNIQLILQPLHRIRIRQIQSCRIPIPPLQDTRFSLRSFNQKMLIPSLPELQRIRSNKRTDPQHHRKSHLMQFFDHRLRILEIISPELPPSIIRRPAIIDHQNTGWKTIFQNTFCIFQDILLGLIIGKFDPGIVYRYFEKPV